MLIQDLGTLSYRDAWTLQEEAHAEVLGGGAERIFLVEHPPVITFGRRPGIEQNLLASDARLAGLGVEVVQSDRGGDITFHGPGQLVAYPIIRIADHKLSVSGYVHALEDAVVQTLAHVGLSAMKDPAAVGVWVVDATGTSAKVCAIGVRIRRGVSLHGLALNVTTDLNYFNLIVPCGLHGRKVTSLRELLNEKSPPIAEMKRLLTEKLLARLDRLHLPPVHHDNASCPGNSYSSAAASGDLEA